MFLDFKTQRQKILIIENDQIPFQEQVISTINSFDQNVLYFKRSDDLNHLLTLEEPNIIIIDYGCSEALNQLIDFVQNFKSKKVSAHVIVLDNRAVPELEGERFIESEYCLLNNIHCIHVSTSEISHLQFQAFMTQIISTCLITAIQKFADDLAQSSLDPFFIIEPQGTICYMNLHASVLSKRLGTQIAFSNYNDGQHEIEVLENGLLQPYLMSINSSLSTHFNYRIVTLRDMSEKRNLELQIHSIAFYDPLTKLPNRILLKERLSSEISRIHRAKTQLGVFYIDLDGFKYINESLGHAAGDKLLIEAGKRIIKTMRHEDFVARLSADEFLVIASGLSKGEYVGKIADNLLQALSEPIQINGHSIVLSASIGIAIAPDDGDTDTQLLEHAEIAMFRAKESGKGKFESFTPELSTLAQQRMILEHDLRKAIQEEQFVVYYQPKVLASTEKIVGMEALVRWAHPEHGLIPPNVFIPLAEETGLIIPIGEWVLKQACLDNKHLHDNGFPNLVVSVNLSMRQFDKQDLLTTIENILIETQLPAELLELEITESIAMNNVDSTLLTIRSLQNMGIQISIDDFGTGYSSLSKLGTLAVDKLKIDRSFISNMYLEKQDTIIASTILTLGKNMNLQIIAEGVETLEQVDFLREHLCDELQGYYFGKPMTIDTFRSLLGGHNSV